MADGLLGWSEGLSTGSIYGVATAVAVLTAVILCLGYSDSILYEQPMAPHDGSSEIPSPIARKILRRGLLAGLVVTLVMPILPGLLVTWLVSTADGVRFGAVAAVGAAMLALV